MKQVKILNPQQCIIGEGALHSFVEDLKKLNKKRFFIVVSPPLVNRVQSAKAQLREKGFEIYVDSSIDTEPNFSMLSAALEQAREFKPDAVVGIGGGSVLDVAKLIAALWDGKQQIKDTVGNGKLAGRSALLYCLPTTAGTGSEVSPNAIILDEEENLKKGIISPYLIPDATYIDPELTKTVPPSVTAATGLDALTHCIEAYANRFAHPVIDLYALEGIRLIGSYLQQAVKDGEDMEARSKMALGSMYGGFCLGPVNTAAVHALSYPLGSEYHIAHGISNAVLLPHVLEFNLEAAPQRYAHIAKALGVQNDGENELKIAQEGVERIRQLMANCNIPLKLSQMDIPREAIDFMADAAMSVSRLLKNNVRPVSKADAIRIYTAAY